LAVCVLENALRARKLATLRSPGAVWPMQTPVTGHHSGPRRSMSITKLKTLGSWEPPRWRDGAEDGPTRFRGRVITGMLTGGDPDADDAAAPEPDAARNR
jgi:hypothetical protein